MKIKIAIFDDNESRRDGLSLLISMTTNMECVGTWPDCRQVVQHVEDSKPDVVLMDVDMPNVNGIEGLILLRKNFPDLKILMQTVFEDDDKVFACICAGADGYILKKASPSELLKGIEDVLDGGAPMTPTIARQVLRLFARDNRPQAKPDINLTEREVEILGLLVKGLSYKMIADKCFISIPTVNTHIRHIYEKLQVNSVAAAVAAAFEKRLI
ncbi:MAG TPA: response regulator transcription factor [Catalimonadaceae bacterium]|nr:response regulator transcription factor [Catalimonadaceae bacterium]HPI11853.1 response regulator transcription factor [Catalimonadaceae bacterium]